MINGKIILAFLVGGAVGVLASSQYFKTKYERIAEEEIESTKEWYRNKYGEDSNEPKPEETTTDETAENEKEYASILSEEGYTEYSNVNKIIKGEERMNKPYIIKPEEFGEIDGYETITLTYYADGVLTDDFDEPVEDIDSMVGRESLEHFGDYANDEDTVYVRNDKDQCDYEILADSRKFTDIHQYLG